MLSTAVAAGPLDSSAGTHSTIIFEPLDAATIRLVNCVRDESFEVAGTDASPWRPYGAGYKIDTGAVRSGRHAVRCEAFDARTTCGAVARIRLNQKEPRPVLIEAWTRCRGVEVPPSPGYSLYADVTFRDGSRVWAQYVACPTDSGEWQRVQRTIDLHRPIESIELHCLFRNTIGTAWFDDAACYELDPSQARKFDGQFVTQRTAPRPPTAEGTPHGDLVLLIQVHNDAGRVVQPVLRSADRRRAATQSADATGDMTATFALPEYSIHGDMIATAGAMADSSDKSGTVVVQLRNDGTEPRPVTIYVGRRFDAIGGGWWDDGCRRRPIAADASYDSLVWAGAGKTGWVSRYPLAVMESTDQTLLLACGREIGPPEPKLVRFGYDAPSRLGYAACDVLLASRDEPPVQRNSGGVRSERQAAQFVVNVRVSRGRSDFRTAWEPFVEALRTPPESAYGLWMPFAAISRIERAEDFGFAIKEGVEDLSYDNAHGIFTFRYTEPQSFWLKMPPEAARDYAACVAALEQAARDEKHPQHREASAARNSACKTRSGRYYVWPRDEPWCRGAVFALNPAPSVPGDATKARLNFNRSEAARYFHDGVDGEYLDSLDGWSDLLNFDPAHLRVARVPWTFDPQTRAAGLLNAFSIWEYARSLRDELNEHGKLMMANFCPTRYWWMAPLFDVCGQEVDWKPDGAWSPMSHEEMWYRRAVCGRRPYHLLMNADFERWTAADTQRYFERCLAYGFFPGFFSHDAATRQYFENSRWYERDRPLFRRYVPLIRAIARAGWEPEPRARVTPDTLLVERFGGSSRVEYWTVHNPTDRPIDAVIELRSTRPVDAGSVLIVEPGGTRPAMQRRGDVIEATLSLQPAQTRVVRFAATDGPDAPDSPGDRPGGRNSPR